MENGKLQIKLLSNGGELLNVVNCFAGCVTVLRAFNPSDLRPYQRALSGVPGAERFSISLNDEPYQASEHNLIGFGEDHLLADLTPLEYLQDLGIPESSVQATLLQYGLDHTLEKKISTLTACETRRIRIIAATFQPTKVLIMNNPFEVLTSEWRERLAELLTHFARSQRAIVVVSSLSHRPESWIDNELIARVQVGESLQKTIGFGSAPTQFNSLIEQIRQEMKGEPAAPEPKAEIPTAPQASEQKPEPAAAQRPKTQPATRPVAPGGSGPRLQRQSSKNEMPAGLMNDLTGESARGDQSGFMGFGAKADAAPPEGWVQSGVVTVQNFAADLSPKRRIGYAVSIGTALALGIYLFIPGTEESGTPVASTPEKTVVAMQEHTPPKKAEPKPVKRVKPVRKPKEVSAPEEPPVEVARVFPELVKPKRNRPVEPPPATNTRSSVAPAGNVVAANLVLDRYSPEIKRSILSTFDGNNGIGSSGSRLPIATRRPSPLGQSRNAPKAKPDDETRDLLRALKSTDGSGSGLPDQARGGSTLPSFGNAPGPNPDFQNMSREERRALMREKFREAIERAAQAREQGMGQ